MLNFCLLKIPSIDKTKYDLPDTAKGYIGIKSCYTKNIDGKEVTIISSECRSILEVEEAADSLIQELRAIKKEAKVFFQKELEKCHKDTNKFDK
jgi:hypothetical protein